MLNLSGIKGRRLALESTKDVETLLLFISDIMILQIEATQDLKSVILASEAERMRLESEKNTIDRVVKSKRLKTQMRGL